MLLYTHVLPFLGQLYYYYHIYNLYYIDNQYIIKEDSYYLPYEVEPYNPHPTNVKATTPFEPAFVEMRLYRQNTPSAYTVLTYANIGNQGGSLNLNQPFKFIVHGYMDNSDSIWTQYIKTAYLALADYNVILVDWRALSYTFYPITTAYDKQIGNYIGDFIVQLHDTLDVAYSNIHLIGHGEGAHFCGIAGKWIESLTGNRISRITGLDPAGPLYVFKPDTDKLAATDASFVDVIHTDRYKFGYPFSIGTVDFYPNDGKALQPGCPFNEPSPNKAVCSHLRAAYFFSESINSVQFIARTCTNYFLYILGFCSSATSAVMGESVSTTVSGDFYLTTNTASPYARNGII